MSTAWPETGTVQVVTIANCAHCGFTIRAGSNTAVWWHHVNGLTECPTDPIPPKEPSHG